MPVDRRLELSRKQGDAAGAARALNNLGEAARGAGDLLQAVALYREGLALGRAGRNLNLILLNLEGLSGALSALDNSALAARLWGAIQAARETAGGTVMPQDRQTYERDIERMVTRLGPNNSPRAWSKAEGWAWMQPLIMRWPISTGDPIRLTRPGSSIARARLGAAPIVRG